MTWKRHILVVANVTASSEELLQALRERAAREPVSYMMLVPATPFGGGRAVATEKLHEALDRLSAAGLEVQGGVGHGDPMVAVIDAWDPMLYDEIIVSTLPMRFSKWMHAGLPERVARATGAPVTHVVCQAPKEPEATTAAPHREEGEGVMGPLSVLAWGGHRDH